MHRINKENQIGKIVIMDNIKQDQKTLQEFKDDIADYEGYKSWTSIPTMLMMTVYSDRAAELYAQQFKAEYDDQRNRINRHLSEISDLKGEIAQLKEEAKSHAHWRQEAEAKMIEYAQFVLDVEKLKQEKEELQQWKDESDKSCHEYLKQIEILETDTDKHKGNHFKAGIILGLLIGLLIELVVFLTKQQ